MRQGEFSCHYMPPIKIIIKLSIATKHEVKRHGILYSRWKGAKVFHSRYKSNSKLFFLYFAKRINHHQLLNSCLGFFNIFIHNTSYSVPIASLCSTSNLSPYLWNITPQVVPPVKISLWIQETNLLQVERSWLTYRSFVAELWSQLYFYF